MKILMIGTDKKLFESGSEAEGRLKEYASLFDELRVIVFTRRGCRARQPLSNLWFYPTNSFSRWCYVWDAYCLGRRLGGIDVVSAQDPFECGLAGWFLARRLGAKLQLQVHTDFLNPYFWRESFLNKIRVLLAKFLLVKADGIRVASRRISDKLKAKSYKLKAVPVVLPIFVDIETLRQAPIGTDLHKKYPQFEKIILMASRLTREKNIGLAIEAMAEVIKKMPTAGLIIVGSGPEEEKLRRKVGTPTGASGLKASARGGSAFGGKSYKLKANVVFEPWTNDLPSYYKTADLFLLTSLYEGYGRTIIEALACGLPVVSTDVGVAREVGAIIATEINLADLIEKALLVAPKAILKNCPDSDKNDYLCRYRAALNL